MSDSIKIRPATSEDLPFLADMLFETGVVSRTVREMGRENAMKLPAMILFLENFGRAGGDFGFVAETADKIPVGAVWARLFSDENKDHGFVAAEIPELAIAVAPEFRGSGIGSKLLEHLIEAARELRLPGLSLAVYRKNPALKLYERFGFRNADLSDPNASSLTMLLKLS